MFPTLSEHPVRYSELQSSPDAESCYNTGYECPDCSTNPDFPTSGLLQFWAINDDLTGCNFDNNTEQKDFRICYYETVDPTVTEEEVAAKEGNNLPCEEDFFPIEGCFGLKFEQTTDRMSMSDYRFWEKIEQLMRECYPEQAEQLLADEDA